MRSLIGLSSPVAKEGEGGRARGRYSWKKFCPRLKSKIGIALMHFVYLVPLKLPRPLEYYVRLRAWVYHNTGQ